MQAPNAAHTVKYIKKVLMDNDQKKKRRICCCGSRTCRIGPFTIEIEE